MNTITVVGSVNLDQTIRVEHMPKPGETIHTKELYSMPGGKGANQAVAASRSLAQVNFIGGVGDDEAGKKLLEVLEKEGINIRGITTFAGQASGQAYIMVDDQGENSIMIHAGANNAFRPEEVKTRAELIERSDFVIAQFESALTSTIAAFTLARNASVKTILNPAPALAKIPAELLEVTDMIVPNETEAEILTGIKVVDKKSMEESAKVIHDLGIEAVIITLGSQGAFYDIGGESGIIPAFKVNTVDTTAAGDTFIGAMTSVLKKDFSNIEAAIRYGNKASSLTVQRIGAQPSIPYQNELIGADL
ncbi:MAG TPA: ribokinase [Tetragenococcus sp.]|nr:ribokinase [Tetragenococcus sp.]